MNLSDYVDTAFKGRLIIHIDWRKAVLPELRKVVTFDEDIYIEGERASDPPLRMIGVAAVVKTRGLGGGLLRIYHPKFSEWRLIWES